MTELSHYQKTGLVRHRGRTGTLCLNVPSLELSRKISKQQDLKLVINAQIEKKI